MSQLRQRSLASQTVLLLCTVIFLLNQHSCDKFKRVVKVSTIEVTNISYTSCSVKGSIIDLGEEGIDAHGFCYGTSQEPTINSQVKNLGEKSSAGQFNTVLEGLSPNTRYYVRTYAQDEEGEYYGEQLEFTTLVTGAATLSTTAPSEVTSSSAKSGGNIADNGGSPVTNRGVCWGLQRNPAYSQGGDVTSDESGVGEFTSSITGLEEGTVYFVRAYAINAAGVAYGNEHSFTTISTSSIPSVTTVDPPRTISMNSATVVGKVEDDGGLSITEKGVMYSLSNPPDPGNGGTTIIADDSGTDSISVYLSELTAETEYFACAYALNSKGYGLGNVISFTTLSEPTIPTVTTSEAIEITITSAGVGGNVSDDGGSTVYENGIWFSLSPGALTHGFKIEIYNGTGPFAIIVSDLDPGTEYYYTAYAINSIDTAYGEEVAFVTPDSISDVMGLYYQVVRIGNQVWMAENFRSIKYSDGTDIPRVDDNAAWQALEDDDKSYCLYENSGGNYTKYGTMYSWAAAMNGASGSSMNPSGVQGVCPEGWHLPSHQEWEEMISFLGGEEVAGGKLKEEGTVHWSSPNNGATDEVGFTALPGGYRYHLGNFSSINNSAYFWTATQASASGAFYKYLYYNSTDVTTTSLDKDSGVYVRCVKD